MDLKRLYADRTGASKSDDAEAAPLDLSKKSTAIEQKRDENEPLDLSNKYTATSGGSDAGDDDVIVVGVQRPRGANRSMDLSSGPSAVDAYRQGRQAAVYSMCKKESYTGGVAFSPYEISSGLVKLKQALMMAKDPQQAKQLAHNFQRLALQTLLKSRLQHQPRLDKTSTQGTSQTLGQSSSASITGDKSSASPAMGTLVAEPTAALGAPVDTGSGESGLTSNVLSEQGLMAAQGSSQSAAQGQAASSSCTQGSSGLPSPREFGPSLPSTVTAANYASQNAPAGGGVTGVDIPNPPIPRGDLPESYQSKYMEYVRKKKFMSGGATVETPPLNVPPAQPGTPSGSYSGPQSGATTNSQPDVLNSAVASPNNQDLPKRKLHRSRMWHKDDYKDLITVAKYAQRLAQESNLATLMQKKQLANQMQMVRKPPPAHCKLPPPNDGKRSYILPGAGLWYPNNVLVNNPRQIAATLQQRQRAELRQMSAEKSHVDGQRKGTDVSHAHTPQSPRSELQAKTSQQLKRPIKREEFEAMRAKLYGGPLVGSVPHKTAEASTSDLKPKTEQGKQDIQNAQSLSGGSVSTPVLISGGFSGGVKTAEPPRNTVAPFSLSPHGGTMVKPVTPQFTGWNSGQYKRVPVANVNPIIHTTPDGITTITHHVTPQQYAATSGRNRGQGQLPAHMQRQGPLATPIDPRQVNQNRPNSRNSNTDSKEEISQAKNSNINQDSKVLDKTDSSSDLSKDILQPHTKPLQAGTISPLNIPSVDAKTDEIKAILRENLDNSALAKKIQEQGATDMDDLVKTDIKPVKTETNLVKTENETINMENADDKIKVEKIRKKKKLKNKGVIFNSDEEMTQKLKKEANMLEKSEELAADAHDVKPKKKSVKRRRRKHAGEVVADLPVGATLGEDMSDNTVVTKKRRKAKEKGSRSPRHTLRYNKNAKYEQELMREEERKLINRAKRVARKRSSQSELPSSAEVSQDDVTSDGYASRALLTSQNSTVKAEAGVAVNQAPLKKIQLKLKRGGIWKRTKLIKSPTATVYIEPLGMETCLGKGGKKLRRRKRKRWYKKRKPLPYYVPQYAIYPEENDAAYYSAEVPDSNLLPPPLEEIYEADSDLYAHAPSIDPALINELKGIVVCRETGETKLHRLTRMGHEDLAERCIEASVFDVNVRDHAGYTALHESCATGRFRVAMALIKQGADVNAAALDGTRPIHDAVDHNRIEMVRLLLSAGADPRLATYSGKTLLRIARTEDMRRLLIGYSQDVNGVTVGEDLEPWDFGIPVPPSECRGGLDILADVPSDSDSECGDLEFELQDDLPQDCARLCLDPEVGPRNYYPVNDLAPTKGLTEDDFQILNFDLTFINMTKAMALEYAGIHLDESGLNDIEKVYGKNSNKNTLIFVERNPTLHSVMEKTVCALPCTKISKRLRKSCSGKHHKANAEKHKKSPIRQKEPAYVTPELESRFSNDRISNSKQCQQKQLDFHRETPIKRSYDDSKKDSGEPVRKKKKKHKESADLLIKEQEWLKNTVDKFCENAKYKKKVSSSTVTRKRKGKTCDSTADVDDSRSHSGTKVESEACADDNSERDEKPDVASETSESKETKDVKMLSNSGSDVKDKMASQDSDMKSTNKVELNTNNSANSSSSSAKSSTDTTLLSNDIKNSSGSMAPLSCDIKEDFEYQACQYSPPPITCSVKGYKY